MSVRFAARNGMNVGVFETGDAALNSYVFGMFMRGDLDPAEFVWEEAGKAYEMAQVVGTARNLATIYDIAKQYAAHVS